ncbi:enoyl-ACP reductase FabI [Curtobacterium sp. MCBD17_019]|uniref:enoyl-ACP reductase FabI n=1 Tax=Curtobacterium sp. MCBD17_019 TaxID=2175669 RepID=UPI000DA99622|nr:enoyl-ACP reductase FabI [Curtobacterium sp. MCBD17_019]PZE73489.1 enoyl-[acyl-carrier-protein] reductase FabI [Curtobacterium sp. MCBD17_019]
MSLLAGKTVLVSGVFTESSIAFRSAAIAQEQGATVILSGFGRRRRITEAVARRLPTTAPVVEFDAEEPADVGLLAGRLREHTDRLDGVVHCISASLPSVVGDGFSDAEWDDVAHSFRVSAYSLQSLVRGADPLLGAGASVVGCTLDASRAWPVYGWAGVAKAAYESVNRYLALHLGPRGIRTNLVAAGPVDSFTMRAIEGIDQVNGLWEDRAPLAWDRTDATPVARTVVALLSDWLPATTGSIIHADGGFHAVEY